MTTAQNTNPGGIGVNVNVSIDKKSAIYLGIALFIGVAAALMAYKLF